MCVEKTTKKLIEILFVKEYILQHIHDRFISYAPILFVKIQNN